MKIYRYADATYRAAYAVLEEDGRFRSVLGDPFSERFEIGDPIIAPEIFLSPVEPRVVIGIALNYRLHAEESGRGVPERPTMFMKLPSSVQRPHGPILLPHRARSEKVDYEGELAVVIGKRCKNVPRQLALDYVFGYCCANDVSARDWQKEWGGGQFCRGKSFDTFCPLGPCLVTADEIPDPGNLRLRTRVNGELMQDSSTSDLVFDVSTLIAFLSASTTLEPNTVILTGTPSGVGEAREPPRFLRDGDSVEVEIEGIGTLVNPVQVEE